MFRVIKTLHEGAIGDFPRKVKERFLEIGKKTSKMCSVFLHKNVQHTVDEWLISWRERGGVVGQGLWLGRLNGKKSLTTKGARGAKAEKPMPAIPVFFVLLVLFVAIPLGLVWSAGLV